MKERYLWDRSGPADPEIERLERLLAPLRARADNAGRPLPTRSYAWLAAAAGVALAAAGLMRFAPAPAPSAAWQVANVQGSARVAGRPAAVSATLRAGETVRTGAGARLKLQADALGEVDLLPDSELRAAPGQRLMLRSGSLHAFIWAPPRRFVVDTPSARAVDLGCEYTLTVSPAGDGWLRVATGWVAFESGRRESFIPAGAACATRRDSGPGIPFFEDAPEGLRRGLEAFELGESGALATVLRAARERDGLTLWHLLTRAPAGRRGEVFDRLAQLVRLPETATRERVIAGDPRAIDLCWNALNLQDASWWRGWEREWQ